MIAGKRVIAVVPARGGSKKVPEKNLRLLGGKPLVAWSIEQAKAVIEIDRVIVSTDDERIARVARDCGAEAADRPAALSQDHSLVIDALKDLWERLKREGETAAVCVLLEPTAPLRTAEDILSCLECFKKDPECDSAATFTEAALNPWRAWRIENDRPSVFLAGAVPWMPRQRLPRAWQLNGAVYAFKTEILEREGEGLLGAAPRAVLMPRERSVDIDDAVDFDIAEALLRRKKSAVGALYGETER